MPKATAGSRAHELTGEFKRRGILAGVAALATAVFARVSASPAEATDNSALVVGQPNRATAATSLNRSGGASTVPALSVTNDNGDGLFAQSTGGQVGIHGVSSNNFGVIGESSGAVGVIGGSSSNFGVYGTSTNAFGVAGGSSTNFGVYGASASTHGIVGSSSNASGVYGLSSTGNGTSGTSTTGVGVYGTSQTSIGVVGRANSDTGVFGDSASGFGTVGRSGSGAGVYGTSGAAGLAGRFDGAVMINGNFTATGIKSAAVQHPDGSHRRLYCLESPDSFFEDFGRAQLVNGRCTVALDSDFAALVHSEDYFVFLTPEGDSSGLYIAGKTPGGFRVHEQQGQRSTLPFSYRVVAKRKDISSPRLAQVTVPAPAKLESPAAPAVPKIQALPKLSRSIP